jgi:hypothetical protein
MLRKLRIAFSVVCGIVCLLLIVMWVRSQWYVDGVYGRISTTYFFGVASAPGALAVSMWENTEEGASWLYECDGIDQWWRMFGGLYTSRVWGTFTYNDDLRAFFIPSWFLVAVTATLGIMPWMNRVNGRFSLRTLLIGDRTRLP